MTEVVKSGSGTVSKSTHLVSCQAPPPYPKIGPTALNIRTSPKYTAPKN